MERSSPLAAMQPPSVMGHFGFPAPMLGSRNCFPSSNSYGPNSFNFKDLSMKKSSSDYFSMKPVRGSSPTASLAADLSQNFHIDQSPQLPTPRRSLFTANLFGTADGRECATTPPLPSSSPGPPNDSMDISPLPHKAPFAAVIRVDLGPVDCQSSPVESIPIPSRERSPAFLTEAPKPNHFLERKKSVFLRPSLNRAKGHSTNCVPSRPRGTENQLPAFKFGIDTKSASTSTVSLSDCFTASPPQERKLPLGPPAALTMGPPRPKQPFLSMAHSVRNGSPVAGHVRKPSNPMNRPRKQFRRSLSMFEHPGDMMKHERKDRASTAGLESIMDVDDSHRLQLPHFVPEDRPDSLPRITKETLVKVLDGAYRQNYADSLIVDCRFEYEYEGGHIEGAVNFNDKEQLARKLFELKPSGQTLLIFHCEYSAHRAPIMAKFIRGHDRTVNDFRYPQLTYPEVYILDGGYNSFFADHRPRCFPPHYVEMDAEEHAFTCEREMGKLRQNRQRTKLNRAHTFAIGQHEPRVDDSPCAQSKVVDDIMMGTEEPTVTFDLRRLQARRMASC